MTRGRPLPSTLSRCVESLVLVIAPCARSILWHDECGRSRKILASHREIPRRMWANALSRMQPDKSNVRCSVRPAAACCMRLDAVAMSRSRIPIAQIRLPAVPFVFGWKHVSVEPFITWGNGGGVVSRDAWQPISCTRRCTWGIAYALFVPFAGGNQREIDRARAQARLGRKPTTHPPTQLFLKREWNWSGWRMVVNQGPPIVKESLGGD